jgi:uncharacterized protein YvpB
MDDFSFLLNPLSTSYSGLTDYASQATEALSSLKDLGLQGNEQGDTSDFQSLLALMLLGFNMQGTDSNSFSSSDTKADQNIMGFSFSSLMAPLMLNLLEQILAKNTRENISQDTISASVSAVGEATRYQINQFDAESQIGGDGINANCGPTSLAMALHALGLRVKGEDTSTSSGRAIELARMSMVNDPSRDGVDEYGNRVDGEQNTFTNFDDLIRGAQAAGATPQLLETNATSIRNAIDKGAKIIVSGTFVGKNPLPWTGDRGSDNQLAPGHATKHMVAITGYDPKTGVFILNDPARNTPLAISSLTLENFMAGNAGALAIFRS